MGSDFEGQRSIQAWTIIAPEEGPQSARTLYKRLIARSWTVDILHAATLHRPVLAASNGKIHQKGEVRKPRHVVDHWAMRAMLWKDGSSVARALLTWDRERVTFEQEAAGAKSKPVAFADAHIWDIVTGLDFVRTATELEEWIGVFAPKPPPKVKAQPKPEASSLDAEIESGVWRG